MKWIKWLFYIHSTHWLIFFFNNQLFSTWFVLHRLVTFLPDDISTSHHIANQEVTNFDFHLLKVQEKGWVAFAKLSLSQLAGSAMIVDWEIKWPIWFNGWTKGWIFSSSAKEMRLTFQLIYFGKSILEDLWQIVTFRNFWSSYHWLIRIELFMSLRDPNKIVTISNLFVMLPGLKVTKFFFQILRLIEDNRTQRK